MRNILFKIIGYIFLRYFIFFTIEFILIKDTKWLKISDIKDGQSIFYFLFLMLFFPILESIIFCYPFTYVLFKFSDSKKSFMYSLLFLFFVVEFFIYVFFTNGHFDSQKFLKVGCSVVMFILFFRKYLILHRSSPAPLDL